jgi:tetratricopeptide (TPR) repeat protein
MVNERNIKRSRLFQYLLLPAAVLLVYGNTLAGCFVWDDNLFAANQAYWQFDLRTIFFSLANGLEYQPVRDLTYLLDIALWGGKPFGFHLTNLLLFTIIVMLVYRLSCRFCSWCRSSDRGGASDLYVALGAALLFALHPLRSEVVAWVTQRNTLLATLFGLLGLLLFCRYLDNGGGRLLAGSLGAFVLAIFSKAIVVVLPLLLLLVSACRRGEKRSPWLPVLPFFVVAAAVALLHVTIARQTTVISVAQGGSLTERVAIALQIPWFYLQKTLLPTGISAYYPDGFSRVLTSPLVLLQGVLLCGATLAVWRLRRSLPELCLGWGWFLITLLPVSNLFATSPVVADRYTFLPAIGFSFAVAALAGRLAPAGSSRRAGAVVAVLLLALLAALTAGRNRVWRSDVALWSDTAVHSPGVAGVWFNLGRAWHRTPRLSRALDAYLRAVRIDRQDRKSLDNAAALFPTSAGTLAERKELVATLVDQFPPSPAGLALIGHTAVPWSHPEAAEALFLQLLEAEPDSPDLPLALANLYFKVGAPERAAVIYVDLRGRGAGRGEAEFGLARIAAASGDRAGASRLLAIARQKGGVPEPLLQLVEK